MAVNDILNQLQVLVRGSAQQLIEISSDQSAKSVTPFVPGERYPAKVQEQVANGRFLVQIRDQLLDLNLPRNTQPGQTIDLRFVTSTPRLTFVLAEAGQLPGQQQAGVNLSDGSRYLNALLDRVQTLANQQLQGAAQPNTQAQSNPQTQTDKANPQAQALLALLGAKPVLESAPRDTAQFAALLKDAIGKSGLFYESHQAQWAAGDKPLTDLLREPQGRLSEPRAFAQAQSHSLASGQAQPAAEATLAQRAAGATTHVASGAGEAKSSEPVHPQTAPLVQQQLETLDTRQLVWQGQVWPGQDLRWEIEERNPQPEAAAPEREWQTRLDLQLPQLGELHALLQISARGDVRISLRTPSGESAQALREAGELLNRNFATAGLQLAQLEVTRDG